MTVRRAGFFLSAILIFFPLIVYTGCGGDSDSSVTAPANPTPLPDADDRIQVGGENRNSNTGRSLER